VQRGSLPPPRQWLLKKLTAPGAGALASIAAHCRYTSDAVSSHINVGLYADNAGAPSTLLADVRSAEAFPKPSNTVSAGRWFTVPINYPMAAATDYWIGVMFPTVSWDIAEDASGTDRLYTASSGNDWATDAGYTAVTTGTIDYSIKALKLS